MVEYHTLQYCFGTYTQTTLKYRDSIIMKFSEVIIIDNSDVHAKSQGQRSKGKVKELKRNLTQIWSFLDRNSSFEFTDGYEIMHKVA